MERIRENFLFIFGCNLFSGDCGGQGGGEGGNKDSGGGEGSPPHPWLTKTNMAGAGTLETTGDGPRNTGRVHVPQ